MKRWKQIGIVMIFVAIGGLALFRSHLQKNPPLEVIHDPVIAKDIEEKEIMVHIVGEVMNPGVLKLHEGDRLFQAVEAAGGLTTKADENKINLSKKLYDEDKIVIPSTENHEEGAILQEESPRININTADKELLKTLHGIGDGMAGRIIEYREKNLFATIDDIKKVPGIGEKTFEQIKDKIKVE